MKHVSSVSINRDYCSAAIVVYIEYSISGEIRSKYTIETARILFRKG